MPLGIYNHHLTKTPIYTEQRNIKISQKMSGRVLKLETIDKIRKSHIGKPRTEETKLKISATRKSRRHLYEYYQSKESIAKGIASRKNTILMRGYWISEDGRKRLKNFFKGHCVSQETRMKISSKGKGKVRTEEFKEHLRKVLSGVNNPMFGKTLDLCPNWKGGKSFEPYPLGWNKTHKEQIRFRDGYKCQICGCSEVENIRKLSVHHIDYDKNNIELNNLISICIKCHSKTNFNREYWLKYFKETRR